MGIVFVHLSDIHLTAAETNNPVLDRGKLIAGAVRASMETNDQCIITLSGDIANNGKEEEYQLAEKLIESLNSEIAAYSCNKPIIILAPGNHDLDFDTADCAAEIRDVIIDKLTPSEPPTEAMAEYCLKPQKNFRSFSERIENKYQASSVIGLSKSYKFVAENTEFCLTMINTARFSKKHDAPGKSWLPVTDLENELTSDSGGAVNIVIMHHPFTWNRDDNKHQISRILEKTCDVVFTGHMHQPDIFGKARRNIEQNLYVEGGILQSHADYEISSFNIVRLTPDGETFTCTVMRWTGAEYEPLTEPYQHKYLRLRQPILNQFELHEDWVNWLEQIGTDFRHPRKLDLKMSDVFVYPDLQRIDVKKACTPTGVVRDKDVLGFIQEKKRVLIAGVEKSGKTSLAKQLFKDLRLSGYVPVLIRGDFKIPTTRQADGQNRLWAATDAIVGKIYQTAAHSRFWQTKISERVLIIDDYSRIQIADVGRDELIKWVDQNFGTVVILCSPGLRIREILNRSENDTLLWGFEHVDILESDAEMRHHLISKWVAAGQDPYQTSNDDLYRTCIRKSQIIDAVIYQGVVPSLPLFILMMMQQLDGHGSVDATNGLYGSLYEVIINDVIKEGTTNPAEIITIINYLTEYSYYVFTRKISYVEEAEFVQWHNEYCAKFNRRINFTEVLIQLEAIGVFRRQEGIIGFKYKYYYWYFVAKYLASHIYDTNVFSVISSLTLCLHLDDAANIMLFLCHFSKDPRILQMILNQVKTHFKDNPEFDLSKSPHVLPTGTTYLSTLTLSTTPPYGERVKALQEQDAHSRPNGLSEVAPCLVADDEDQTEMSLVHEVSSASHLIRICGQIIRNFYGDMPGETQEAIIRECYGLSLRIMSVLFDHIEVDKDLIAETIAKILQQRNPKLVGTELDQSVRRSLKTVALQITYGYIKHVSNSIGLLDLETSFDKVLNMEGITVSHKLLDISTRLDFFDHFPETKILEVSSKIDRTDIGFEVLRILTWEHFKLFKSDYKIRQRICNKLDIKFNEQSFLDMKDKKVS